MIFIGYLISAMVLTVEINFVNIKKIMKRLKCTKCQRVMNKSYCAQLKHSIITLWSDIFMEPMRDLLEDDEFRVKNVKNVKKKELVENNNESLTTNDEIDHDYHFPYLE